MTDRDRDPRSGPTPPATPPAGASGPPATPAASTAPSPDGPFMSPALATPREHTAAATPPPDHARAWLARLFAGEFAFPAVAPAACGYDLPAHPADAAARANGCRDLFVIDAGRADRRRLIEALAGPADGGVLVLTPDLSFADQLVERLAGMGVEVVRAVSPDERADALPPAVAARTSAALHEDFSRRVAAAAAALGRCRTAAARLAEIDGERRAVASGRDHDSTPPADLFAAADADHDAERAKLEAEVAGLAERRRAVEAEGAAVTPAVEPPKSGLLSRLFGKARPAPAEPADAERPARERLGHLNALDEQDARLRGRLADIAAAHAAARDRILAEAVAARRAAADGKLAALDAEAAGHHAEFPRGRNPLHAVGLNTPEPNADAVAAAFRELDSLQSGFERLESADGGRAARRLLPQPRVVVGPPESVGADPAVDAGPFARLVLDGADGAAEPVFLAAARRAERWVLLGRSRGSAQGNGFEPSGIRNGVRPGNVKGNAVIADFFTSLVRRLDREPWTTEGDRLVCRLAHPDPDHRDALTREPLLDRPEVELRFTAGVSGEPVLAEVAFPAGTPIAGAKAFLADQLGVVLLRPTGECHTHAAADGVTVCWPAADRPGQTEAWVDLAPGVREKVAGDGPAAFTAAVAFDAAHGWDAESAASWLADHVPAGSPSRVAVLPGGDTADEDEGVLAVAAAG